jgi:uncharacterized protein involved in outer membrane biogenesis
MDRGRLAIRIVLFVATGVVAVAAAAVILLQTPWARDYLRHLAERRASQALGADVTIGELGGSLLFGATVDDLTIVRRGRPLLAVDRVRVDYDPSDLLRGRFDFQRIALERPVVQARALGAIGGLGGDRSGGGRTVRIGEVVVKDGRVVIGSDPAEAGGFRVPDVIRDLDADLSVRTGGGSTRIGIDRLSFKGEAPAVTLRNLSGTVTVAHGDLRLDDIQVQLAESSFAFGGTIENIGSLVARGDT